MYNGFNIEQLEIWVILGIFTHFFANKLFLHPLRTGGAENDFGPLSGKIGPARNLFFHQKLRLEKLGIYMSVKTSIDKERRKP